MKLDLITSGKKFSPLFWVLSFGALNDNILKNAIVILVLSQGMSLMGLDSKSLISLAGALFIFPFVIFSPLAGQISDKWDNAFLSRLIKWWELLIVVVASLGFYFQSGHILFGCLLMMGVQSTFFGPIKYSVVPRLVEAERLVEANAYVELGTFVAILIGTLLGGLGISLQGGTFIVIGLLMVIAALGLYASYQMAPITVANIDLKIKLNPVPSFRSLWTVFTQSKPIIGTVVVISWFWMFGAGLLTLLPVFVKDFLGGNEALVTLFLATFTLGIGAGSVLCEHFSRKRVELCFVALSALCMGLFLIDMYFAAESYKPISQVVSVGQFFTSGLSAYRIALDFFFLSVAGGFFIVPLFAFIQKESLPESRAQLIAANNILNALFMVIVSLLIMWGYSLGYNVNELMLATAVSSVLLSFGIYLAIPQQCFKAIVRIWSSFYSFKFKGEQNYPEQGAYIVACNHVSFIDWLFIMASSYRPVRFIIYFKYARIPLAKWVLKQAGVVPIAEKKENPKLITKAFAEVDVALAKGDVLGIFPEGGITYDGEMNLIKRGIAKMVEANNVPVVPVKLHGLWGSVLSRHPKKKWYKEFKRRVELNIGEPIPPKEFSLERLKQDLDRL